jgi:hypothetical protein
MKWQFRKFTLTCEWWVEYDYGVLISFPEISAQKSAIRLWNFNLRGVHHAVFSVESVKTFRQLILFRQQSLWGNGLIISPPTGVHNQNSPIAGAQRRYAELSFGIPP